MATAEADIADIAAAAGMTASAVIGDAAAQQLIQQLIFLFL
jgi:hypothetical protein